MEKPFPITLDSTSNHYYAHTLKTIPTKTILKGINGGDVIFKTTD